MALLAPAAIAWAQDAESQPITRKGGGSSAPIGPWDGWPRVLLALALVAALIFLARFLLRRAGRRTGGFGLSGPVQTLWRGSLSGRQQLSLVRLGRRVLLLASCAQGATTLCEITNEAEVADVLESLQQGKGDEFLELMKQKSQQFEQGAPGEGEQPATRGPAGKLADKIRSQVQNDKR